jgi:hypothetical protein
MLQSRDRKGVAMGMRPTDVDEDAAGRYREINNLRQLATRLQQSGNENQLLRSSPFWWHLLSAQRLDALRLDEFANG